MKLSSKLLAGSVAVLRIATGDYNGFYLEIELSEDNKKNELKIVEDDKIVNEILEVAVPWLKRIARSHRFRGIMFVESTQKNKELFDNLEKLGAQLVFIDTTKQKRKDDGSNTDTTSDR